MKKLIRDNKAQTAAAIMSVILLIVGFAVAGLLFTFTQVLGGQTYNLVEDDIESISSYTNVNTTFTADNFTWTLIYATMREDSLEIYNTTTWTDRTSNFTVNYTTGYINLTSPVGDIDDFLNGTTMRALYQYDDETIKNAIQSGIIANFEAQQQIGNYMPIIALAIIITIVIGLIIGGIASKFIGPGGMGGMGGEYGGTDRLL